MFYSLLIKLLKVTTTPPKFLRIEQEIDLETFIHVSALHEGKEHGGGVLGALDISLCYPTHAAPVG